jgi:hypothetical protein
MFPICRKPDDKLRPPHLPLRCSCLTGSVVAEVVSRLFAARYEPRFGLMIPEWRILAVIGESGAQTTQQVIDRTRMDRVRVSRAVNRLSDKRLWRGRCSRRCPRH